MSVNILIGKDKYKPGEGLFWRSGSVINPHWMILGTSGSGKTYNIRKLITGLARAGTQTFVFDAHGDIETQGSSSVVFSNASPYGFNPLEIDPDPEYGGINRRIQTFMSMVNRYSYKLGVNQQAVMRHLLMDIYSANGYRQDDVRTWVNERAPALSDMTRFTYSKLKSIVFGGNNSTISSLNKLNKTFIKMNRKVKNGQNTAEDAEQIDKLKENCRESFSEYLDKIKVGREIDDYLKYDSKDMLKSIYNRLESLMNLSIFGDKKPAFDSRCPVFRYDIRSLTDEEQGYLVEMYLEKLFLYYKRLGITEDLRAMIVLDEAHKFISKESSQIMNIMMREARKFGLGLMLASHNLSHFSEEILTNCASKLILGVDEIYHDSMAKKLGVKVEKIRYIKPRRTALSQIKFGGAMGSTKSYELIM